MSVAGGALRRGGPARAVAHDDWSQVHNVSRSRTSLSCRTSAMWRPRSEEVPRPVDVALRALRRTRVGCGSAPRPSAYWPVGGLGELPFGAPVPSPPRAWSSTAAKPLFRRQRPDIELTPLVRRLTRQPWITSFPSGHAASAAAFTCGVALELPVAGAVLAPVAAAVGYSRVHVGVHHVSDVLAGAVLGAEVALALRRCGPYSCPHRR
jgi:membrane-associated phospholipid phosphatase